MTREEFAKGWLLLIVQPWGRRYAEDTDIARTQSEFYYHQLKEIPSQDWWHTCEVIASGSLWPSVDDIRGRLGEGTGHPGVEQAWGIVGPSLNDEGRTVVWTDEMREAFGVALPLADDMVAARMTFKETYGQLVKEAVTRGTEPHWQVSLGLDKSGREGPLVEAVQKGRLLPDHALKLIPQDSEAAEQILLLLGSQKLLGDM